MRSITIIIVSYNQEDVISRCLDSILVQKDFGLKHIVVSDDCSQDRTWEILNSYADKYPDMMVIHRNEVNLGIYPNCDKALSLRGEADLYCLLAGDDALCEGWFEQIQRFIEDQHVDFDLPIGIYSDWKSIDSRGNGAIRSQSIIRKGYSPFGLFIRGYVCDRSFLMNDALLKKQVPLILGKGLNLTEWAWESLKHKYIEKAYYLPYVGSLYYLGIGVSQQLTLSDSDYHTRQEIIKWQYFIENYLDEKEDINYAYFGIKRAQYYKKPTVRKYIEMVYYFYKGKLKGEAISKRDVHQFLSLAKYGLQKITIKRLFHSIQARVSTFFKGIKLYFIKKKLADIGEDSYIDTPVYFYGNPQHIHIGSHSVIYGHFKFVSMRGHFYVGNHTMSAQGLTVVTDNHVRNVGVLIKDVSDVDHYTKYKDVIVEDDVWLGSNVTLLPGVTIGRGAFVGAGAVIRKSVPPYSVVVGNPQSIIGFNMSPSEIIEHEMKLYPEEKRLSRAYLEEVYSNNPQRIICRRKDI